MITSTKNFSILVIKFALLLLHSLAG